MRSTRFIMNFCPSIVIVLTSSRRCIAACVFKIAPRCCRYAQAPLWRSCPVRFRSRRVSLVLPRLCAVPFIEGNVALVLIRCRRLDAAPRSLGLPPWTSRLCRFRTWRVSLLLPLLYAVPKTELSSAIVRIRIVHQVRRPGQGACAGAGANRPPVVTRGDRESRCFGTRIRAH